MDSSDKLILWSILGCLMILAGSIGSCTCIVNYQDNTSMTRMVAEGADALSARCAVKDVHQDSSCAIIAARTVRIYHE